VAVGVQPVDVAATLASLGGIGAIVIGARATRPKADAPEGVAPLAMDPDDRPAALRERLSAVEVRVLHIERDNEALEERVQLLEALRAVLEEFRRQVDILLEKIPPAQRPPSARRTRS
jgi:succinate dehydrogenase/fumarate reductase flavoprotein subunit